MHFKGGDLLGELDGCEVMSVAVGGVLRRCSESRVRCCDIINGSFIVANIGIYIHTTACISGLDFALDFV